MKRLLRSSLRSLCLAKLKSCACSVVVQELPGALPGGWPTLHWRTKYLRTEYVTFYCLLSLLILWHVACRSRSPAQGLARHRAIL